MADREVNQISGVFPIFRKASRQKMDHGNTWRCTPAFQNGQRTCLQVSPASRRRYSEGAADSLSQADQLHHTPVIAGAFHALRSLQCG